MTDVGHDVPTARAADAPARPRERGHRSIGELIVDLVLVAGIGGYLYTAQSYPPDGRQIPTVVGLIGLAAAVIQLIGWFVGPLWTFTHGDTPSGSGIGGRTPGLDGRMTEPAGRIPEPRTPAPDTTVDASAESAAAPTHQSRDTVIIMVWAAGFLGAILTIGYEYGVPLFFLVYFLWRRSWKLAIILAVVMWALTRFVFIDLLTVPLPSGVLFQ